MQRKKNNPCLSATIDRSCVGPIRKGIIWSGEGSDRSRSRRWLQHGADLQLENNDGCLGQHWWRGSTAPAHAHLTCTRWRACMSERVNHQNTLLCQSQMCWDKPNEFCSDLNMCPRLLSLSISQTTLQPKQVNTATSCEDKTGNYLCPAASYVNTTGKAEVCLNERGREFTS